MLQYDTKRISIQKQNIRYRTEAYILNSATNLTTASRNKSTKPITGSVRLGVRTRKNWNAPGAKRNNKQPMQMHNGQRAETGAQDLKGQTEQKWLHETTTKCAKNPAYKDCRK